MTYKFRLPLKGFYTFKLFGQTHVPNQSSSTYPVIGSWMLECKSEWKGELYPDSKTTYGPVDVFHSSGLSLKGGNSSHIIAEDGTCCVVITKPSDVELIHDLKRDDVKQRKCSFEDHRNDGTESYFLLRLPERGYYQLNLFAKKGKHGSNYPYAGTWLIESKSPWQGELYPLQDMAWGVDDEFTNLGLQLEGHNSSRIVAIDGKCVLAFKTPSPISTKFQLYSDERRIHEKKTDEYIEVTSDIKMICFSMELPDPGFYKFELYGNLKEKENLPYLGCWLIEYER
ncbi:uncharacterized protein LOC102809980 [Saccoglossus kowalevskii]|uniref:Uncharacterized protein LOC102809980 n=1 Tax=Saccoglossus kowalevskii TaxID=10224 RepID=A0ABM0MI24_SACKO|nr:PREDICTED: uncharacterized protein LOC102809980 [Saccoglossus kowalevskii]